MRSIALASIMSFASLAQAQFATVYVTPPTNGCNGVWAVQITSVYCTSTSPYTFVMEPDGCLQLDGWAEQMGNFLIPLCAIPCSLTVTTGDGVTCSGSTSDAPIGMDEERATMVNVNVIDAIVEVTSTTHQPALTARMLDMDGRVISTRDLAPGRIWHLPAPGSAGTYVLVVQGAESPITKRFVILK